MCYSNGTVKLKSIEDPPESLCSLMLDENVTKSSSFLKEIRKYNRAFQMTSIRGLSDDKYTPTFKVEDQIYRTAGPNPNESKCLEIYFVGDENHETK